MAEPRGPLSKLGSAMFRARRILDAGLEDAKQVAKLAQNAPRLLAQLKDSLGDLPQFSRVPWVSRMDAESTEAWQCRHCGRNYPTGLHGAAAPDRCDDDCPGQMSRDLISELEG